MESLYGYNTGEKSNTSKCPLANSTAYNFSSPLETTADTTVQTSVNSETQALTVTMAATAYHQKVDLDEYRKSILAKAGLPPTIVESAANAEKRPKAKSGIPQKVNGHQTKPSNGHEDQSEIHKGVVLQSSNELREHQAMVIGELQHSFSNNALNGVNQAKVSQKQAESDLSEQQHEEHRNHSVNSSVNNSPSSTTTASRIPIMKRSSSISDSETTNPIDVRPSAASLDSIPTETTSLERKQDRLAPTNGHTEASRRPSGESDTSHQSNFSDGFQTVGDITTTLPSETLDDIEMPCAIVEQLYSSRTETETTVFAESVHIVQEGAIENSTHDYVVDQVEMASSIPLADENILKQFETIENLDVIDNIEASNNNSVEGQINDLNFSVVEFTETTGHLTVDYGETMAPEHELVKPEPSKSTNGQSYQPMTGYLSETVKKLVVEEKTKSNSVFENHVKSAMAAIDEILAGSDALNEMKMSPVRLEPPLEQSPRVPVPPIAERPQIFEVVHNHSNMPQLDESVEEGLSDFEDPSLAPVSTKVKGFLSKIHAHEQGTDYHDHPMDVEIKSDVSAKINALRQMEVAEPPVVMKPEYRTAIDPVQANLVAEKSRNLADRIEYEEKMKETEPKITRRPKYEPSPTRIVAPTLNDRTEQVIRHSAVEHISKDILVTNVIESSTNSQGAVGSLADIMKVNGLNMNQFVNPTAETTRNDKKPAVPQKLLPPRPMLPYKRTDSSVVQKSDSAIQLALVKPTAQELMRQRNEVMRNDVMRVPKAFGSGGSPKDIIPQPNTSTKWDAMPSSTFQTSSGPINEPLTKPLKREPLWPNPNRDHKVHVPKSYRAPSPPRESTSPVVPLRPSPISMAASAAAKSFLSNGFDVDESAAPFHNKQGYRQGQTNERHAMPVTKAPPAPIRLHQQQNSHIQSTPFQPQTGSSVFMQPGYSMTRKEHNHNHSVDHSTRSNQHHLNRPSPYTHSSVPKRFAMSSDSLETPAQVRAREEFSVALEEPVTEKASKLEDVEITQVDIENGEGKRSVYHQYKYPGTDALADTEDVRQVWENRIQESERYTKAQKLRKRSTKHKRWKSLEVLSASLLAVHETAPYEAALDTLSESPELRRRSGSQPNYHPDYLEPEDQGHSASLMHLAHESTYHPGYSAPWFDRTRIRDAISHESIANIGTTKDKFEKMAADRSYESRPFRSSNLPPLSSYTSSRSISLHNVSHESSTENQKSMPNEILDYNNTNGNHRVNQSGAKSIHAPPPLNQTNFNSNENNWATNPVKRNTAALVMSKDDIKQGLSDIQLKMNMAAENNKYQSHDYNNDVHNNINNNKEPRKVANFPTASLNVIWPPNSNGVATPEPPVKSASSRGYRPSSAPQSKQNQTHSQTAQPDVDKEDDFEKEREMLLRYIETKPEIAKSLGIALPSYIERRIHSGRQTPTTTASVELRQVDTMNPNNSSDNYQRDNWGRSQPQLLQKYQSQSSEFDQYPSSNDGDYNSDSLGRPPRYQKNQKPAKRYGQQQGRKEHTNGHTMPPQHSTSNESTPDRTSQSVYPKNVTQQPYIISKVSSGSDLNRENLIAREIREYNEREAELRRSRSELGLPSLTDVLDHWKVQQGAYAPPDSPNGIRIARSMDHLHQALNENPNRDQFNAPDIREENGARNISNGIHYGSLDRLTIEAAQVPDDQLRRPINGYQNGGQQQRRPEPVVEQKTVNQPMNSMGQRQIRDNWNRPIRPNSARIQVQPIGDEAQHLVPVYAMSKQNLVERDIELSIEREQELQRTKEPNRIRGPVYHRPAGTNLMGELPDNWNKSGQQRPTSINFPSENGPGRSKYNQFLRAYSPTDADNRREHWKAEQIRENVRPPPSRPPGAEQAALMRNPYQKQYDYVPVETRIEQEMRELQEREDELRRQRAALGMTYIPGNPQQMHHYNVAGSETDEWSDASSFQAR